MMNELFFLGSEKFKSIRKNCFIWLNFIFIFIGVRFFEMLFHFNGFLIVSIKNINFFGVNKRYPDWNHYFDVETIYTNNFFF